MAGSFSARIQTVNTASSNLATGTRKGGELKTPIRIKSGSTRDLIKRAVDQGFSLVATKSNKVGLLCPHCGEMIILSGTEKDSGSPRFDNQVTQLRRHCLKIPGKPVRKECLPNGPKRKP